MTRNPADMTPAQVQLAISYIDRAHLVPNYRLMPRRDRYALLIGMVEAHATDSLIAKDLGVADLAAVQAYFLSKYNEQVNG